MARGERSLLATVLAGSLLPLLACGPRDKSPAAATGPAARGPRAPEILTTELPPGLEGDPYRARIDAGACARPCFAVTAGALPAGLALDPATGALLGIPRENGEFCFTAGVSSSPESPRQASRSLLITINSRPDPSRPVPSLLASRSTGTAPLAVFFDASGTTCGQTSRPFHELHYAWNFSDPGSPRPRAAGALAAHVFERPGCYPVRLDVLAPDGSSASARVLVTVLDPDAVFSGANTVCFANQDAFTGAPAGCQRVVGASFDEVLKYAAPGRRLLLRRGDTFHASGAHTLGFPGPFHIGAFGPGLAPDSRGIFANNPVVLASGTAPLLGPAAKDHRLTDLVFRPASPGSGALIQAAFRVEQLLLSRLRLEGFNMAVCLHHDLIQYFNIEPHDQVAVADCLFSSIDGKADVVFYTGGRRLAFLGNRFENLEGDYTHLLRVTYADQAVIAKNTFKSNRGSRHCIKLHGPTWPAFPQVSRRILIADNRFESGVNWLVALGPQNDAKDERVAEVVVERNHFLPTPGARICLYVNSCATTLRNNLIQDDHEAPAGEGYIYVGRRGIEPTPAEVAIYHNTAYCDHGRGPELTFAYLSEHQGGPVLVKNNLLCAPFMARPLLARGPAPFEAAGNVTPLEARFAAPAAGDFTLLPGSPAIDASVELPVLDDLEWNRRPAPDTPPDAGACEHH